MKKKGLSDYDPQVDYDKYYLSFAGLFMIVLIGLHVLGFIVGGIYTAFQMQNSEDPNDPYNRGS